MNRTDLANLRPIGQTAIRIVAALLVVVAVAACGKKGPPQPPSDQPNTYPKSYPHA